MSNLTHLEEYANELVAAVNNLANCCRNGKTSVDFAAGKLSPAFVPPESSPEMHRTRRTIKANIAKLQRLLEEPVDFLQQLAVQVRPSSPNPSEFAH